MSLTGKPESTLQLNVINDGFFPDLLMGDFLDNYRIPSEYADNTITNGLVIALMAVNDSLAPLKTALLSSYSTLQSYADLNKEQIHGEDTVILQYQKAVFCHAKAWLLQQFNTLNRRDNAENVLKESPMTEQWWLSQSQEAVQWLFKKTAVSSDGVLRFGVQVFSL
jgi:hypothetical protein